MTMTNSISEKAFFKRNYLTNIILYGPTPVASVPTQYICVYGAVLKYVVLINVVVASATNEVLPSTILLKAAQYSASASADNKSK
mgnify:CR=1 FL=1